VEALQLGPRVYNKRSRRPWPEDAVLIDRTTPYGNPYPKAEPTRAARIRCLCQHAEYLLRRPDLVALIQRDLKGRDLLCWCDPLPCHGHTLIGVANSEDPIAFLEQVVVKYTHGYRR
jgi:hypothetical protein